MVVLQSLPQGTAIYIGIQEAADKSVLANQFVTGLLPELKTKLAGKEGDFYELLVRACFEEARLHYLELT